MRQLTHGMPQGGLPAGITRGQDGKFVTPFGAYDTLEEAVTALRMNPSAGGFNPPPEPAMARPEMRQPMSGVDMNQLRSRMGSPAGMNPQPPQPPQPQSMGFMDRIKAGMDERGITGQDIMQGLGSAMLGLSNDPNLQKMGMGGFEQMRERKSGNRTLDFLRSKGVDEATIKSIEGNPQLISAYASALLSPKKDTALMQNYEFAKANGFQGSFTEFMNLNKAGTTVNVGGSNESELSKSLAKKRGDQFASYLAAGDKAAALMPELQTLEQLSSMAPNGPLVGRVAELFPEFNDASAAFMSMVQRIAPTMRVEGSGSTSDIEFNAMLRSLGSLRNTPEANKMIYDAFRKKALLDQARAQVVTMYENGEYDLSEARTKLGELNKQNILSDQLRGVIEGSGGSVTPSGTGSKPANMSKELWDAMTPQERALFN